MRAVCFFFLVCAMDAPFDFGMTAREVAGIDVVVSANAAVISGRAARSGGKAVADYAVLLFSTDSIKRYSNSQALRLARSSQNGEFPIGSLPPGVRPRRAQRYQRPHHQRQLAGPATLERLRPLATPLPCRKGKRAVVLQLAADR